MTWNKRAHKSALEGDFSRHSIIMEIRRSVDDVV